MKGQLAVLLDNSFGEEHVSNCDPFTGCLGRAIFGTVPKYFSRIMIKHILQLITEHFLRNYLAVDHRTPPYKLLSYSSSLNSSLQTVTL
jgi:hypothetical protein